MGVCRKGESEGSGENRTSHLDLKGPDVGRRSPGLEPGGGVKRT